MELETKLVETPPEKVLVTVRADSPPENTIIQTPAGMPNIQVVTMPWWQQVLVRTARTFIQALIMFLPAAQVAQSQGIPIQDYGGRLLIALSLAATVAVGTLLHNAYDLLTELDSKHPKMRA